MSNASIGPLSEIWELFMGRYGPNILGSAIERVWRPSWEAINLANRSLLEFRRRLCYEQTYPILDRVRDSFMTCLYTCYLYQCQVAGEGIQNIPISPIATCGIFYVLFVCASVTRASAQLLTRVCFHTLTFSSQTLYPVVVILAFLNISQFSSQDGLQN
jgi:hypothetical protein